MNPTAMNAPRLSAVRGEIVHFLADPAADPRALEHFADGVLIVRDGHVAECGPAAALLTKLPSGTPLADHRGRLILPGFVDTHVHYPQTDIIASHGEQLLEWLERYTFPAERRFADPAHAAEVAGFFCDELLRNGTTTAAAFATVHPASVEALFEAAQQRRMRLITGKVLMDRNCPDFLRDTAETGYAESRALIERWHNRDRLLYAITPRFAPTSTPAQMALAGRLFREHPGVFLQSHLAENRAEVAWVAQLHPEARSYLDVYERAGQLGMRALFAHCLWLDDSDRRRMAERGAAMSFCPTSNLFLGSGLFDLARARARRARGPGHGRGRRHQPVDAADPQRGLQGAAARRPVAVGGERLPPRHPGRRAQPLPRRPHRQLRARQGGRLRRPRPTRHPAARPPQRRMHDAGGAPLRADDAGRRPCGGGHLRDGRADVDQARGRPQIISRKSPQASIGSGLPNR